MTLSIYVFIQQETNFQSIQEIQMTQQQNNNNKNNQILKWMNGRNRHLSKEDT